LKETIILAELQPLKTQFQNTPVEEDVQLIFCSISGFRRSDGFGN